ncbi:MAG TPA: YfiR family protein [Geothrix sp.]|nr:YfiR family protein [Geothrix sp.]
MLKPASSLAAHPGAIRRLGGIAVLWAGMTAMPGIGMPILENRETEEFAVKAQILVKLIPYVRWPEVPNPGGASLVIAVVGSSPFQDHLDRYIQQNPSVQGRSLRVIYVPQMTDDLTCDLLFICPSQYRASKAILERTRGRAILTVADDKRLAKSGVMVSLLVLEDNKVHIVLNRRVAQAEHLDFSSLLLRMAKIVDTPPPGP